MKIINIDRYKDMPTLQKIKKRHGYTYSSKTKKKREAHMAAFMFYLGKRNRRYDPGKRNLNDRRGA